MRISVIVCTRNRPVEILEFTKSLFNQIELPSEYIIVDSSDTPLNQNEGFVATINHANVPVVYLHTSPGLTKQRNAGVKAATSDILYFFDDDVILYPDYLQVMNETFLNYPEYHGGMGTIENARRRRGHFLRRLFMLQRNDGNGRFQPSGLPTHPYGRSEFLEVEILAGGLTGYRATVFDEFRFDEMMTGYAYMEDLDFSRRVSRKYKLFYNPKASLIHNHVASVRDDVVTNRKMYIRNHTYLFFKNFYPYRRLYIVAYLWSIIGLFILAAAKLGLREMYGYLLGLKEIIVKRETKPV